VDGAAVTIGAGGIVYSSSPAEARFGLGAAQSATIDVRWPSGFASHVSAAPADQIVTLVEPHMVAVTPRVAPADGTTTVKVTITPAKADGTPLGPGASVTVDATAGTWQAPVVDVGDGSYTRTLVAPASPALAVVRVGVNGSPITVYPRVEFR
ncbi:MAG: invasin domain 3-containing protein, partial [Polyangiaceae bacterium]